MIPKPKSELTVIFISLTIMLVAFASIGYYYLTQNQTALMNQFENQRVIRATIVNEILNNISSTLQAHDDRLVKVLDKLNITDNE